MKNPGSTPGNGISFLLGTYMGFIAFLFELLGRYMTWAMAHIEAVDNGIIFFILIALMGCA